VIAVLILIYRAIEVELHYLWEDKDPMIFDRVPLKYLFQILDVVTVVGLAISGGISAWRELRKP
jgi:hypothetical protein